MKKNIYKAISSVLLSLMTMTLIPKNIYADTLNKVEPELEAEIIINTETGVSLDQEIILDALDEIDPELEADAISADESEVVLDEIDPELRAETTLNPEEYFELDKITFNDENGIVVDARSALLIEPISGTVLFEKNPNEQFAPASVTKIMTMLLAMEAIDSNKITLYDKITCSENAKKMGGSTMLLETGEVRTVEEILKGIAIASGNDAAVAMAEYLAGTEEAFVILMNKRAEELGMTNTVFKNCNGLPIEGHISTARDIATMSLELLKHKDILNYSGIYMETITEGRRSPIELVNHNKLVRFFEGCDGLKTGYTEEAKYCISATACRNGVRVLTVIMGAPSYKVRNRDASMLMNFGLSKYEGKKIFMKDQDVEEISLSKNSERFFIAKAMEDLVVVVPRGSGLEPSYKILLNKDKDQYKAGDVIGVCEAYLDNNKIGEIELYSDRDVDKAGFFENLKFNISNLFEKGV